MTVTNINRSANQSANHSRGRIMRQTHLRSAAFVAAATAAILSASAQPTRQSPAGVTESDNAVSAESPNAAGAPQSTDSDDVEFLVEALHTGMAEVEMGRLAQQRGTPAVKEFGKKLESDHARAAQEIKVLLGTRNVTTPAEPTVEADAHSAALAKLSGAEFDAAFLKLMVASHEEAIEKYGAQTHANPNKQLSEFAAKTLPTLRAHLATAQSLQRGS
jgi:putative membrane protein